MTTPVDTFTLIFVTAVISATLSITLFVLADRSGRDGLRLWSLAMALQAVAFCLFLFRGSIDDFFRLYCPMLCSPSRRPLSLKPSRISSVSQFHRG